MAESSHRTRNRPKGAAEPAAPDADETEKVDDENAAEENAGENAAAENPNDGNDGNGEQEREQPVEDSGTARYSADELRTDSRGHLGCSPHIVAGALSGEPGKLWTIAEAREAVNSFRTGESGE
jgi:hypothetical protein